MSSAKMAVARTLIQRGLVLAVIGWVAEIVSLAIPYWWYLQQPSNGSEIEHIGIFKVCRRDGVCISLAEDGTPDWVTALQACVISGILLVAPGILLPLLHLFIFKDKKYFLILSTVILFLAAAFDLASITTVAVIMVTQKPYGAGFPHAAYFLTCVAAVILFITGLHFQQAAFTEDDVMSPASGITNPTQTALHTKAAESPKTVPVKKLTHSMAIDRSTLVVLPGTFRTTLDPNTYHDLNLQESLGNGSASPVAASVGNALDTAGNRSSVVIVPGTVRTTLDPRIYRSLSQELLDDKARSDGTNDNLCSSRNLDPGIILRSKLLGPQADRRSLVVSSDSQTKSLTSNRNTFPFLDELHNQGEADRSEHTVIDSSGIVHFQTSDSTASRNSGIIFTSSVKTTLDPNTMSVDRFRSTSGNPSPTLTRKSEVIVRKKVGDTALNSSGVTIMPGTVRSTLDPNIYPSLRQAQTDYECAPSATLDSEGNVSKEAVSSAGQLDDDNVFVKQKSPRIKAAQPKVTVTEPVDFVTVLRKKISESYEKRRSMSAEEYTAKVTMSSNRNTYPFDQVEIKTVVNPPVSPGSDDDEY